jgi:ligand-binding sensor domain-containing protein
VDKIQASDDAYEGSFLVGDVAVPSAYDGVNVIAPDHNPSLNPGRVYFVRAADGNIAACSLGGGVTYPDTAAFDGQNVWVSTDTGYVVALSFNQTSRTCGPPICTTYLGSRLYDLISDGNGSIWVTAVDNNAVYQLSSGCGVVGVVTGIPGPIGIVYDGTYLWTANDFGYSISQIAPGAGGGTVVSTTALSFSPWWIAFDGENIWTTGPSAGQVSVMSTSSPFSTLNYYQTCGSATSVPLGLAFDGANMWVGCEGVNLLGKM